MATLEYDFDKEKEISYMNMLNGLEFLIDSQISEKSNHYFSDNKSYWEKEKRRINEKEELNSARKEAERQKIWETRFKKFSELRKIVSEIKSFSSKRAKLPESLLDELQNCSKFMTAEERKQIQRLFRESISKKVNPVKKEVESKYKEAERLLKKEFKSRNDKIYERNVFGKNIGATSYSIHEVIDKIRQHVKHELTGKSFIIYTEEYVENVSIGSDSYYLEKLEQRLKQDRLPKTKTNIKFFVDFTTIKNALASKVKCEAAINQYQTLLNALEQRETVLKDRVDFKSLEKQINKMIKQKQKEILKAEKLLEKVKLKETIEELKELEIKEAEERKNSEEMIEYRNLVKKLQTIDDPEKKKEIQDKLNALGNKLELNPRERDLIDLEVMQEIERKKEDAKISKEIAKEELEKQKEVEISFEQIVKEKYEYYKKRYLESNNGSPIGMESFEEFESRERNIKNQIEKEEQIKAEQEYRESRQEEAEAVMRRAYIRFLASGGKATYNQFKNNEIPEEELEIAEQSKIEDSETISRRTI